MATRRAWAPFFRAQELRKRTGKLALAGASLVVASGAVAYSLGYRNANLQSPTAPPDTLGYDAEKLTQAGWKGRVGIRQYMANSPIEDRGICSGTQDGQLVVGVLDGHGGWQVAEFVQENILKRLEQGLLESPATSLSQLVSSVFQALDEEIARRVRSAFLMGFGQVAKVGACTLLCFVAEHRIVVANAGDCRVVLGRKASGAHPSLLEEEPADSAAHAEAKAVGPLGKSKHAFSCAEDLRQEMKMTALEERRMPWMNALRRCGATQNEDVDTAPAVVAWDLSNDHNARVPFEQLKLLREHPLEADIIRCKRADACYVKGRLQPTRSIGDLYLKMPEFNGKPYAWVWGTQYDNTRGRHVKGGVGWGGNAPAPPPEGTAPYITAEPEIIRVDRSADDVVLVAGTDGLWDYLESQEAVDIATAALERSNSVGVAADELREEVLRRTARKHGLVLADVKQLSPGKDRRSKHDDVTVIVVDLRKAEEASCN
uniref:PPM-type phosphatase domain-containing protein n=2 Tax=Pinguiococcus pyrenoidosus TaxID=172671 RepID=A0A7R9UCV6_9STRA|mmetsp:Transcript_5948/g.23067  ORF Transcript_5948/g.23067 Transcript_5948/m.23067 type:complete len:487 (+) Transcript_5948:172-1632(+)